MPRIERIKEINGWSEWLAPKMRNYRLACCDCGLSHDLDFFVIKPTKKKRGRQIGTVVAGLKVIFRARRNNRSTAQMRRGKRNAN